jgi:hypothetical protein
MFRTPLLILCLAASSRAEVIDKLVIIVGQHVITELQLDEELRMTAFLNGSAIERDLPARREAADRLVEQLLIRREMDLSRYPLPDSQSVDAYLDQVRARFSSPEAFRRQLAAYNLSEETLRDHLALQLTTLRFIEYRFSSDMSVSDEDIQRYYQNEMAHDKKTGSTAPSFAAAKESIRQKLVEQRTDESLDNWLEEARKHVNIVYLEKDLR